MVNQRVYQPVSAESLRTNSALTIGLRGVNGPILLCDFLGDPANIICAICVTHGLC